MEGQGLDQAPSDAGAASGSRSVRRRNSRPLSDRTMALLLVGPPVALIGLIFVVPLGGVVLRSFQGEGWGLDNYHSLIELGIFAKVLETTVWIALMTASATLIIGFAFAYVLWCLPERTARVLLLLSSLPLWVALLARIYAWTILLGRKGIVNELLQWLGILDEPADLLFNRFAVVVSMVHVMLPIMIVTCYGAFRGIDRGLLDAAGSLGASPIRVFTRVFIPLCRSGVTAGFLLVLILSLGFFVAPAVLGAGADITVAMYVQSEVGLLRWEQASAMSTVLLILTLGLFAILSRAGGIERVMTGGMRK